MAAENKCEYFMQQVNNAAMQDGNPIRFSVQEVKETILHVKRNHPESWIAMKTNTLRLHNDRGRVSDAEVEQALHLGIVTKDVYGFLFRVSRNRSVGK